MDDQNKIDLKDVNKVKRSLKLPNLKFLNKKDAYNRDNEGKFTAGAGGLSSAKSFNLKRALPVILIVALAGGYAVFRSFAATIPTPQNGNVLAQDYRNSTTITGFEKPFWTDINDITKKFDITGDYFYIGGSPNSIQNINYVFSPDGKKLYYFGQQQWEGTSPNKLLTEYIYSYDLPNMTNKTVVRKAVIGNESNTGEYERMYSLDQDITADGSTLVFSTYIWSASPTGHISNSKIYSINTDGTNLTKVYEYAGSAHFKGLDNNDNVIFEKDNTSELFQINLDGTNEIKRNPFTLTLTNPDGTTSSYTSRLDGISPSGSILLYTDTHNKNPIEDDILLVNTIDLTLKLTLDHNSLLNSISIDPNNYSMEAQAWSPDSQKLIMIAKPVSAPMSGKDFVSFIVNTNTGSVEKVLPAGFVLTNWQPLPPTPPPAPAYTEDATKLKITGPTYITQVQDTPTGAKKPLTVLNVSKRSKGNNAYASINDLTSLKTFLSNNVGKTVKVCAQVRVPSGTSKIRVTNLLGSYQVFQVAQATTYAKQCTTPEVVKTPMSSYPAFAPRMDSQYADTYLQTLSVEVQ